MSTVCTTSEVTSRRVTTGKYGTADSLQEYDFTADDLTDRGEIGRGAFGTVNKMVHRVSRLEMAVKVRAASSETAGTLPSS